MDLSDRQAWDDSDLIDSWNAALEEYKKYHSIHAEGRRLEDVLSKSELEQVYAQRRKLEMIRSPGNRGAMDEVTAVADEVVKSTSPERDLLHVHDQSGEHRNQGTQQDGNDEVNSKPPSIQAQSNTEAVPAGLMPPLPPIAAQDEAVKNMLVSWYYAGYYAGLFEGQRRTSNS